MSNIRSLPHRHQLDVVDADVIAAIHDHALQILERTGIATTSERLLKLMAEHDQQVDFEQQRIRFDPAFVESRRALAPRTLLFGARDPSLDLVLDGTRGYLSPDGCAPQILDLDTGRRRASTKADLGATTRLSDALPEIGLMWRSVAAGDTPSEVRSLHEVEVQFANTTKHLQTGSGTDGFNARGVVELCRTVAGSADALRERPLLSSNQCVISPLFWDEGPVDAIEIYAEAGIPISVISMAIACATTPATLAGLIALTLAEILSGLTILQTLQPGAPALCTGYPSTMDLHSGALNLASGPDDAMAHLVCTQVLKHLGLPSGTALGGTGAKSSDWQAGMQAMLSAMATAVNPADIFNGAGGLYGSNVFSPTQLLLDREIFDVAVRWAEGYAFDEEDFATPVIEEVGPGGHFLGSKHTLRHMRELWRSQVMDTSTWEAWETAGRPEPAAAAEAEARRLLAEHQAEPLDDGIAAELARIVAAYEREALADH